MPKRILILRTSLLLSILLSLISHASQAQNAVDQIDTILVGTWKGSSLCQVKNSPCHDETVVYHISKKQGVDSFYINASKIVNGVEDEMGILPFVYNKKTNQLISTSYGLWTFNIEGDKIEGTLYVRGQLYRKINVYKQH